MNVLTFFTSALDKVRAGVGMLLPIFAEAADTRTWPAWMRWGVHLLLLGLVLFGLWTLERSFPWFERNLAAKAPPVVRDNHLYLCLLFVLVYLLCWVAHGLIRLFAADDGAAEFPDLAREWKEAVTELAREGVRLDDPDRAPPVFLVLGRPAAGVDALFKAAGPDEKGQWAFRVRTPKDDKARLRVYACYDPYAVFVTLPDAGGWGYLTAALNGDGRYAPAAGSPDAADAGKTLRLSGTGTFQQLGLSRSEEQEFKSLLGASSTRAGGLAEWEKDRLAVLSEKGNKGKAGVGRAGTIRLDALRTGRREVRFVCGMIARDRWPLCPVNGVLALVPWAAGEEDEVAAAAGPVLAGDLAEARDVFRLNYPTVAAVCDVDTARGFGQLRAGFQPAQLRGRLGQRLPLVPAPAEDAPKPRQLIGLGVKWIARAVIPAWTLQALRPDAPTDAGGYSPNRELYLFMREVHRRVPRFASILGQTPVGADGTADGDLDGLPLFGGCYLVGSGAAPVRRAFVTGVFQWLADEQGAVAWTRRAYAEDGRFRRLTLAGYVLSAVLVAGAVALLALRVL